MTLSEVYYKNALALLSSERRKAGRINAAYKLLSKTPINAAVEDWLTNPFVRTALTILKGLSSNFKVREAIRLLSEAGKEQENAKKKRSK